VKAPTTVETTTAVEVTRDSRHRSAQSGQRNQSRTERNPKSCRHAHSPIT